MCGCVFCLFVCLFVCFLLMNVRQVNDSGKIFGDEDKIYNAEYKPYEITEKAIRCDLQM
jgi:hypothetical protein